MIFGIVNIIFKDYLVGWKVLSEHLFIYFGVGDRIFDDVLIGYGFLLSLRYNSQIDTGNCPYLILNNFKNY